MVFFYLIDWLCLLFMNYIVLKHNSWWESGILSLGIFDFSLSGHQRSIVIVSWLKYRATYRIVISGIVPPLPETRKNNLEKQSRVRYIFHIYESSKSTITFNFCKVIMYKSNTIPKKSVTITRRAWFPNTIPHPCSGRISIVCFRTVFCNHWRAASP